MNGAPRPIRILLVDADEASAAEASETLRLWRPCEIAHARTQLEAIRAGGGGGFDAALVHASLPEGSGLDVLDMLRLASPGIRILVLAPRGAGEDLTMRALSRGACDVLVRDAHLAIELPRRMDKLLDRPTAEQALVETLAPARPRGIPAREDPADDPTAPTLHALLGIVRDDILAAGVWDLHGRCIAGMGPDALAPSSLERPLATLQEQVAHAWARERPWPAGHCLIARVAGGLVVATALQGLVVGILLAGDMPTPRAVDRADEAALHVMAALRDHGDDLAAG